MTTHFAVARRRGATLLSFTVAAALGLMVATPADAAIVPTVPLGTAANYSVLGFATVTNTGPSVLAQSLGLWSGTSITGFPPGLVTPPGVIDTTNAAAQQAQSDRMAAYIDAAGRSVDATTTADLGNLNLLGGVYAGPSKSPLEITGPLVLDGAGDPNSVFIFQTDSTLITASSSTVTLINGAQECNVFWQVGSSATLGTGSVFVGNILASASITVTTGVTVHGRALAGAAVTLDTDVFTTPSCATGSPPTTTPGGGGDGGGDGGGGTTTTSSTPPGGGAPGPGVPGVGGPPRTGAAPEPSGSLPGLVWLAAGLFGLTAIGAFVRGRMHVGGKVAGGLRNRPPH